MRLQLQPSVFTPMSTKMRNSKTNSTSTRQRLCRRGRAFGPLQLQSVDKLKLQLQFVHSQAGIYLSIYQYTHTHTHTHMHACMHRRCMHACIHTYRDRRTHCPARLLIYNLYGNHGHLLDVPPALRLAFFGEQTAADLSCKTEPLVTSVRRHTCTGLSALALRH